jgi:mono/diheme cytochrome c family protein
MNGMPSQPWLNTLLVLIQQAQSALLRLWHALGFTGDSHGQAAWPWPLRVAGETLAMDPGLARQLLWSLALMASAGVALLTALVWRRRRFPLLILGVLMLLPAWPTARLVAGLVFSPAVPTSFHVSPTGFSVDSIAHGAQVYARQCVACHGLDGRGEGPLAATLAHWPPTFVSQLLARRADGEMFWHIQQGMRDDDGHSTMPAFSAQLDDYDTWAVLDYIKALAAGTGASLYGAWPLPVALPDVAVRCGEDPARPLAQWRGGRRVRLVAVDGDAAAIPLDDPRMMTLLVTRDGKVPPRVPQLASDCTAASTQAWEVVAQIAGVSDTALHGMQMLVDRAGWLRARSAGKAAWSDADLLCKSGQPAAASGSIAAEGLAALLGRMDAEPVRFVKGGFVH